MHLLFQHHHRRHRRRRCGRRRACCRRRRRRRRATVGWFKLIEASFSVCCREFQMPPAVSGKRQINQNVALN